MALQVFQPLAGAEKQGVPRRRPERSHSGRPETRTDARTSSATDALGGVREVHAAKVRATFRELGGRFSTWDDASRLLLVEALFGVENDLEHRQAAMPPRERHDVHTLHAARLRLERELGWAESPSKTREGSAE